MLFRDQLPVVNTSGNNVWGDVFVCSFEEIYSHFMNILKHECYKYSIYTVGHMDSTTQWSVNDHRQLTIS